ncbi:MAG TPA: histidine--tRNA ligase [Armatimonadota bacterium]|jgi:histidyl-tRNA synthetase
MTKGTVIRPVKGTRDFYPELMALRTWLYGQVRAVAERYGYQEYDAPVLETLELYAAKSGEELVKEQSFAFVDRGGDMLVLRPETTPSLARMVAQRQQALSKPIRWWTFGPCWRYEQPQQGRTREFYQWNLDLIGADSVYADVEVLQIITDLFRALGITGEQVAIRLNHRGMMSAQLQRIGFMPEQLDVTYRLIDKREKLTRAAWFAYGQDLGIDALQLAAIEDLLSNRELWKTCPDLVSIFALSEQFGFREYLKFDPTIIRGLGYYTGMVFEAWDRARSFRAILGGGRYGNLVADVGGQPLGGIGVGMGDVVLGLLLERLSLLPSFTPAPAEVLVTTFSPELQLTSTRLAVQLRQAGIRTEVYPDPVKLNRQPKYANTLGIRFVVVCGPEEAARDVVTVRNMVSGEQVVVACADLAAFIHERLAEVGSIINAG